MVHKCIACCTGCGSECLTFATVLGGQASERGVPAPPQLRVGAVVDLEGREGATLG